MHGYLIAQHVSVRALAVFICYECGRKGGDATTTVTAGNITDIERKLEATPSPQHMPVGWETFSCGFKCPMCVNRARSVGTNTDRTGRLWHDGPPPAVGWWPASANRNPDVLRWWDGEHWSETARRHLNADTAARQAARSAGNATQSRIQWTERWWLR